MECQPEVSTLSNSDARRLTDSYRHYLSCPNIVSISYCDEKKRDQKTGRKVLCFGVVKKLECDGIVEPNVLLPKSVPFETENKVKVEIPVQMVEEGEIFALNATYNYEGKSLVITETIDVKETWGVLESNIFLPKSVLFETEDKVEVEIPVQVVEEGEIFALNPQYKGGSLVKTETIEKKGTLGVNTHYKGVYRLLSAAHVLTQFDESNIGKKILASSTEDYHFEDTGATVTGQVHVDLYDRLIEPPVYAKQDLAWANITEEKGSPKIKEIGDVGGIRDPDLEEFVQFYGGISACLHHNLKVLDVSTKIRVNFNINGATKYGYFEEVVKIDLTQGVTLRGDSGSAVIAQRDKSIVGILLCGSLLYGYFTKLTF